MARYVLPSSTPADITFMRFIEPRTTAEDANGSGEALLVLGSANCISGKHSCDFLIDNPSFRIR
jgi:hypothetical protein